MKKLSFLISFLLLTAVFTAPLSVSAAQNAGIKPGSFFYGFVTTFEKVNLFFTFNPEKKAEKALKYAEKRLAEAEEVAGDKNSDAVKTAISGYEKNIAIASEASKKVKDETKAETLLNLIADNASKHQEILSDVLSKVPDEAKEAITKALEASRKGQEEAMQKIAELKTQVEQLKKEVVELKKQQSAESATSQKIGAQSQPTSIKELKKEIEELKKQQPSPAAAPPTIQSSTPQTEVKTEPKAGEDAVTLTNALGISYTFENPILNKQRIRDLLDAGFAVTKGKLPEGIIIKPVETSSPTLVQTKSLEIMSVSAVPDVTSVRIEWQTNIPTNSKIFLSGGSLSSKVYNSESGLSTRHIVNMAELRSNVNYSYEIESIIGDQVSKKQGLLATKSGELTITIDKTLVQLADWNYVTLTARYTENGKTVPVEISFSAPNVSKTYQIVQSPPECGSIPFITRNPGQTIGGGCTSDGKVTFEYLPKTLGTHTISVTANGATKSAYVQVVPYAAVNPNVIDFINLNPKIDLQLTNTSIGGFTLSAADEPIELKEVKYDSDIKDVAFFLLSGFPLNGVMNFGPRKLTIYIPNTKGYIGAHTLTITELKVVGLQSGKYRAVSGLPMTFTFEIKDVPVPETIPIKTTYTYPSIPQILGNAPGIVGSFNIKFNYNSTAKITSCSFRMEESALLNGRNIYSLALQSKPGSDVCTGTSSETGIQTDSFGVSVAPYVLYVDLTSFAGSPPDGYSGIIAGNAKFYIENIKVYDLKTGVTRSIANPIVFDMAVVKP